MKKYIYLIIPTAIILLVLFLQINETEENTNYQDTVIASSTLIGENSNDGVLAKVGNKIIYIDEFYRRAEYTIRPKYCNGNYNIDKMIILNSLIGEKLLAIEYENRKHIKENEHLKKYIQGRREQAMRQVLYLKKGTEKVKLESTEILRNYRVSGRKYNFEYFAVENEYDSKEVAKLIFKKNQDFADIYTAYTSSDKIPTKEIDYFSDELPKIQKAVFADTLSRNQILGPIVIDDSTRLFMRVKEWTDRIAFGQQEAEQRLNDVKQKLSNEKAETIYSKYIAELMKGKKLDFNREVFYKLANILGPAYLRKDKEKKDRFLESTLNKPNEIPKMENFGSEIEQIVNEQLFKINDDIWKVSDLQNYLEIHPFVFRKKRIGNREFARHLQFAIIDLIQDKYLTEEAYKMGLDKDFRVLQYEYLFRDANIALYGKYEYLKTQNVEGKNWLEIVKENLTPYIRELQKKYSDSIEINITEFNKIRLTTVDLFATQRGVPFPIVVPSFPLITTSHQLDYGIKIE